jgi:muconate/chloromuconate cycloisomerase
MKLTNAEVFLTKVPTRRAHKMTIGTTTFQDGVFLRLSTDEGITGWGEAPHMVGTSFAGETQLSVALQLRERLLPAVLGKEAIDIEARQLDMDRVLPRNPRAKSAINIALHDIIGKMLGIPVSRLLGGVVRDRVPLSWSIGMMPFDEGAEEAKAMVAKGFGILKLKVGAREKPEDDIEMARRIRAAVGPNVRIRADANQGFDVPTAIRVTRGMQEAGLESMEQPVGATDLEGMAEVRRAVTCYVMADESANTPQDVYNVARLRAADLISIYINNGGGITAAKKMAIVAEAAGLRGYVGGALEGPIAARACLHFAASSPSVSFGCEMVGQFLLTEDLGTEAIPFEGGALVVPTGPGLGGELDLDKARRFEIERFSVPAS